MLPYWHIPIFQLGPIPINTWGFFVGLGFAVGIWVAYKKARSKAIIDMAFWIIVASLIGARIGHIFFYEWGYYSRHLWEIVRIDQGGLSSFGGFVGAGVVFWWYGKKRDISIFASQKLETSLSLAFPLGWAIGRIGCFLIHDHPGVFTNFVLGVKYPDGVRHDLGLYEALFLFFYFFIFSLLFHKRHFAPGSCAALIMIFYGIMRFFLDFLRAYDIRYFGLTPAQYGCIILFGCGLWLLIHKRLYQKYDKLTN